MTLLLPVFAFYGRVDSLKNGDIFESAKYNNVIRNFFLNSPFINPDS